MHPIFVQTHLASIRHECQRGGYPCLHHSSPWWKSDILECVHRLHDLRGHEQLATFVRKEHADEVLRANQEVPYREERETRTRIEDSQIARNEAPEEVDVRGRIRQTRKR